MTSLRLLLGLALLLDPVAARAQAPEAAAPSVVKLPDGPASVRGLAEAATVGTFDAQVTYQIPIQTSSGAPLAPSLALTYSGALGNGPVGLGWGLEPASIRRSLRHGVPAYDGTDELELIGIGGGGRLVPVGDEYRVEGKGTSIRVERAGGGWRVTDENGVVSLLGIAPSSRIAAGGRIAEWFIEHTEDLGCSSIDYTYVAHGGEVYLERITWGPGGSAELVVSYEDRPDPVVSLATGFRVETAWRMAELRVESFDETAMTYELRYDDEGTFSRLSSVHVRGRGGVDALPTVRFTYAPRVPAATVALVGTGGWRLGERGVTFADVDGDGVDDLLRLEAGNHAWRRNAGGAFREPVALEGAAGVDLEESALIDLDGDARAELVRIVDDTWRAYRLDGATWTSLGVWPGTDGLPINGDGVLADLDGDGRTDVVVATTGGLSVSFGGDDGMGAPVARPPVSAGDPPVDPGTPSVRFVDVNGDGLADVVWLTDEWMKVFFGRGDGTFEVFDRVFWPWGPGSAVELDALHLVDLDRDGLVDLVRVTAAHVLVYPGLGNHRFSTVPHHVARPEEASADALVSIADANGNGSLDVVWSSPRGMWALDLAGATHAGMLASIDDGMGAATRFTYEASGLLSIAAAEADDPWARNLPVSIPVPVRVDTVLADGSPTRTVRHGVRDGFWDAGERRFGGFLVGRTVLPGATAADIRVEEARFHPGTGEACALRGKPWHQRVEDGLGNVYTVTETTWEAVAATGLGDDPCLRVAVTRETRVWHHEGVAEPLETLVEYEHDGDGRVIEERHHGRVDLRGDEKILRRTYASQASPWIRDRILEERLLEWDETVVSHTQFRFADASGTGAQGDLRNGWPATTWGLLEEPTGPRWTRIADAEYDGCGLTDRVYQDGVERDLERDPATLRTIAETVSPAPGETLVWEAEWDAVVGQPTAFTDPNGDTIDVTYDGLGRPIARAVRGQPAHEHVAYAWDGARPRTTTWVFDGDPSKLAAYPDWTAGAPWRESVDVTASGGKDRRYRAIRLGPSAWRIIEWTERDGRGRAVLRAHAFEASSLPSSLPAGVPAQTATYDALDRLVEQRTPGGHAVTKRYAALTEVTEGDELSAVTLGRDGLGRVIQTERMIGELETTSTRYDAAGRIVGIEVQGGLVVHTAAYDTLGRVVRLDDPDLGERLFRRDDLGRLTELENAVGEIITFTYDDAGRLVRRASGGDELVYHYDTPYAGSGGHARGRLTWVEEPTGRVELAYDVFGRQAHTARTIDGVAAQRDLTISPSGLTLVDAWDDGLEIVTSYDAAAQPILVEGVLGATRWDLWTAVDLDAAGRVVEAAHGNGVVDELAYDANGLVERIRASRPGGDLYDVRLQRNGFGGVAQVFDDDGVGLDHAATFGYDGGGRLVEATLGSGGSALALSWSYDALQNMTSRTGPAAIDARFGDYVYGEDGAGPRQLTSIVVAGGGVVAMAYDGAGRQITEGDRDLGYDGFDQLVFVKGAAGTVEHAYGLGGARTRTIDPSGGVERWFADDARQVGDTREHYVTVGGKVVARITLREPSSGAAAPPSIPRGVLWIGFGVPFAALLLLGARASRRRRTWTPAVASLLVAIGLLPSCGLGSVRSEHAAIWTREAVVHFHAGFSEGPGLLTREDATVLEERRHEPFGAPVDAYRESGAGGVVGDVDYEVEPLNELGKPTDVTTGWSFHGARWMSPATARWHAPDPAVRVLSEEVAPWDLHPYQYARQAPTLFWDPDGWEPVELKRGKEAHLLISVAYMAFSGSSAHMVDIDKTLSVQVWEKLPEVSKKLYRKRPDILDREKGVIFEIKPLHLWEASDAQVKEYVDFLTGHGQVYKPGPMGSQGTSGVARGKYGVYIWEQTGPGRISYVWIPTWRFYAEGWKDTFEYAVEYIDAKYPATEDGTSWAGDKARSIGRTLAAGPGNGNTVPFVAVAGGLILCVSLCPKKVPGSP